MNDITLVKGDAGPTITFTVYQNGSAVDLSGTGVAATFRMRLRGATSNAYSTSCTGLNSSGRCQVPLTTTALATAGYYDGEIYITGLTGGSQTTEIIPILIRSSLA